VRLGIKPLKINQLVISCLAIPKILTVVYSSDLKLKLEIKNSSHNTVAYKLEEAIDLLVLDHKEIFKTVIIAVPKE
jgi:hypothetical protein